MTTPLNFKEAHDLSLFQKHAQRTYNPPVSIFRRLGRSRADCNQNMKLGRTKIEKCEGVFRVLEQNQGLMPPFENLLRVSGSEFSITE